MLTAAETITDVARDAQQAITLLSGRPAQAYVCVVSPVPLPAGPTIKTNMPKSVANTMAAAAGHGLNVSASRADAAIARLLRLEKLEADWDGSEAAKPIDYSLKDARNFIRKLSPDSVIPRAALHADGHAILFMREPDIYAELEVLGCVGASENGATNSLSMDGRCQKVCPKLVYRFNFSKALSRSSL
jgi:hypothetical protein